MREKLASPTESYSFQMLQNVPKNLNFSFPVFIAHVVFFSNRSTKLALGHAGIATFGAEPNTASTGVV